MFFSNTEEKNHILRGKDVSRNVFTVNKTYFSKLSYKNLGLFRKKVLLLQSNPTKNRGHLLK